MGISLERLADDVTDLGRLAMAFGLIDRTACYHADQRTRESDTDHTVMLGLVACSLARRLYPDLDTGLIAEFALVHDLVEVYAGDTPTLRINDAGRAAKKAREHAAWQRLNEQFGNTLPWVPLMIARYETTGRREAGFVQLVDKLLPKLVHQIDQAYGLIEESVTPDELEQILLTQGAKLGLAYAEFPELIGLHAVLSRRAVAVLAGQTAGTQ